MLQTTVKLLELKLSAMEGKQEYCIDILNTFEVNVRTCTCIHYMYVHVCIHATDVHVHVYSAFFLLSV